MVFLYPPVERDDGLLADDLAEPALELGVMAVVLPELAAHTAEVTTHMWSVPCTHLTSPSVLPR